MFLRYILPILLGFAAKQLKKNNAAKGAGKAGNARAKRR